MITKYKFDIYFDEKYYYKYTTKKRTKKSITYSTLKELLKDIFNFKISQDPDVIIYFNFTIYLSHGILGLSIKTDFINYDQYKRYIEWISNIEKRNPFEIDMKDTKNLLFLKYNCSNNTCYVKNTFKNEFKSLKGYSNFESYLRNLDFGDYDTIAIKVQTNSDKITLSACFKKDKDLDYVDNVRDIARIIKFTQARY